MSVLNSTVIERAWLSASNDFQQRIPNPTVNSYSAVIENLFAPMNNDLFNEFCGLLNGINATYVDIRRFDNPLAFVKKTDRDWRFGFSERHLAVHFLKGFSPRFDDETLLKVEPVQYEEWYYSLNYETRYEFSWSRYEIAQAFAADGYGYDDLLSATITQMMSSANYDEMNAMLQVFAEADHRFNGLYRYNISAFPTTENTAKELLKGIRAVAGRMRFPSMLYNHIPVPVHTDGSRLVLYVLPETLASLDVDALSAVFQLSYANPKSEKAAYRIVEVPEFPIPNVCAILADEDAIFWRDYMTGLEPPFYNPGNRTMKYYYYESAAVGFNPAAPICCFTTEASTTVPTVTMTPTGIEFSPDTGNVEPGGTLQLYLSMTGSVSNDSEGLIGVEPDACMFTVTGTHTNEDTTTSPIALNSKTYVDNYGVLHVQKSGLVAGDTLTITAKAAYINPSNTTSTYTDTFTATII